jgi:hypothetical protein
MILKRFQMIFEESLELSDLLESELGQLKQLEKQGFRDLIGLKTDLEQLKCYVNRVFRDVIGLKIEVGQ